MLEIALCLNNNYYQYGYVVIFCIIADISGLSREFKTEVLSIVTPNQHCQSTDKL